MKTDLKYSESVTVFPLLIILSNLSAFQVNMEKSLESQEPFSVLVHKLTDIIASATFGDIKVCITLNISQRSN